MAPKSHHSKGYLMTSGPQGFQPKVQLLDSPFYWEPCPTLKYYGRTLYCPFVTYWGWSPTAQYCEVGKGLSHALFWVAWTLVRFQSSEHYKRGCVTPFCNPSFARDRAD